MTSLKTHARNVFIYEKGKTPWLAMAFSCLATTVPLLWGYFNNDILHAIFSGLMGHFLFVCDHPGSLKQRLSVAAIAAVIFSLFFFLGVALKGFFVPLLITFAFFTYGLAVLGSISIKIERIYLLAIVNTVVAYYNPDLHLNSIPSLNGFNLGAVLFVMLLIIISSYFFPTKEPVPVTAEKYSLRSSFKEFHLYGLTMAFVTTLAFLFGEYLAFEKTYWIVITLLVIMRPDKRISLHRSFQRLAGTLIGVVIVDILLIQFHSLEFYIALCMLSTFFIPWGISKNYWIGTFFITLMVITLLSMPTFSEPDLHISMTRFIATLYGCGFSFFCIGLYDLIKSKKFFFQKKQGNS